MILIELILGFFGIILAVVLSPFILMGLGIYLFVQGYDPLSSILISLLGAIIFLVLYRPWSWDFN